MPSTDTFGEIKGLPAGATVEPIVQSNGTIRGLPAGAVVEPITAKQDQPAKSNQPPIPKQASPAIVGLPKGATVIR